MKIKRNDDADPNAPPEGGAPFFDADHFVNGAAFAREARELLDDAVIHAAAAQADEATGWENLQQLVTAAATAKYGSCPAYLKELIADLDAEIAEQDRARKDIKFQLDHTPQMIPAAYGHGDWQDGGNGGGGKASRAMKPWNWSLRDCLEAVLVFMALNAALIGSLVTTRGNLVASGVPIFLQDPLLPWLLAGVAPMASVAIKCSGALFRTARNKALHARVVYGLAIVSFAAWLVLYAQQYQGLAANVDLFAEPSPLLGAIFAFLQVATEVLVGAALYIRLDQIMARYEPLAERENPEALRLNKEYQRLENELRLKREDRARAAAQKEQIDAALDTALEMARMAFAQVRARLWPNDSL